MKKFIKKVESVRRRNRLFWMINRFKNPNKYLQFSNSRKWVFIMGCTNSGTRVLDHILSDHSDIASLPWEGQFLTDVIPRPRVYKVGRVWAERLDCLRMTDKDKGVDMARLIHDWKIFL
jgi:hypothetical protein